MNPISTITYYHERTGDTYQVNVLGKRFLFARRHIGPVGPRPIVYDNIEELPDGVRHDIEQLIEETN